MAATDPQNVRAGFATAIRRSISDAQCTGYLVTNGTAPWFDVDLHEDGVQFDASMGRGSDEWWWKITAVLATGSDEGAQRERDKYLVSSGGKSVKGALEYDRTLGGVVESLHVTQVVPREFQATDTGAPYLGAEFTVRVLATGA